MANPILGKLLLAQAASEPYRRNTRIPLGMHITIRGKDKVGSAFEESTQTIDVSKKGIKTSTTRQLLINAKIRISNGHVHKALPARVVWQGHTDRPEERAEMGVELLDSHETGDIWTLESLPDDWQEGPVALTTSQKLEYFWARNDAAKRIPDLEEMPGDAGIDAPINGGAPGAGLETDAIVSRAEEIRWEDVKTQTDEALPLIEAPAPAVEPATREQKFPAQSSPPPLRPAGPGTRTQGATLKAPAAAKTVRPEDSPAAALNQLAQLLCEQAETITQGVAQAVGSVESAARESIAQLELERQKIEVQLGKSNLEHKERLAIIGTENANAFRLNSESLLEDFKKRIQQEISTQFETLGEVHQKRLTEINARSAAEVRQKSEELLADFHQKLRQEIVDQLEAVRAEHQKQLSELVVTGVQKVSQVAANFKDAAAVQVKDLQEKNLKLQHQNEEYIRTSQEKVREEIDAAKSAVAPRALIWIGCMGLMAALALIIFAYGSTQPVMRLRAEPPAEYADGSVNADQQDTENKLARAYWNSAVNDVQRTYGFHTVLPDEAPPEFRIRPQDAVAVNSRVNLNAVRDRYWQRLRKVWENPLIWNASYEWNTDWITTRLKSLGQLLRR